ncbi:hypothetical protein A2U01_0076082 [Trifolium medium]|uniref:Uncharacterized protein n=1 Tax=Trifolium medium TaxID=97028 RepID=A0A392T237_9FABA|nr:hypothetical protein [Trifolium medium]
MQEGKASGCSNCYLKPEIPGKWLNRSTPSKEMMFQTAPLHVFIDKKKFCFLVTISQQLNKVRMIKSS